MFAVVEQQRQFVYFAHRGMGCVFSVILCSLAGHPRGEFAPRSSGGGIGWKRGGLAPPNPPADFRCGPAGLRVPTSPRGCGHRQVPEVSAGARGHRQVPGAAGRCHIYRAFHEVLIVVIYSFLGKKRQVYPALSNVLAGTTSRRTARTWKPFSNLNKILINIYN